MANTAFHPTHEIIDDDGDSRGLYLRIGGAFCNEDAWFEGGRYLMQSELDRWGWSAVALKERTS